MAVRTTPYPLPDPAIAVLPPEMLAQVAVTIARRIYEVDLDYSLRSLACLDALLQDRFRLGRYTLETFPNAFALAMGAYLGVVLQRQLPGGCWGASVDNLYRTPLPFLLYSRGEYERQINVVEDCLTLLWTGDGLLPTAYLTHQRHGLRRLGILHDPVPVTV